MPPRVPASGPEPCGGNNIILLVRLLSLRSRRLEVAGERENGRVRGRHVSPSRAPVFSFAHYFQAPATQARDFWANSNIKNDRVRLLIPSLIIASW